MIRKLNRIYLALSWLTDFNSPREYMTMTSKLEVLMNNLLEFRELNKRETNMLSIKLKTRNNCFRAIIHIDTA